MAAWLFHKSCSRISKAIASDETPEANSQIPLAGSKDMFGAMNILLASSEIHPFSKSGGLGDMVGAMAKALATEGHHVSVVTPLYRGIRDRFPEIRKSEW